MRARTGVLLVLLGCEGDAKEAVPVDGLTSDTGTTEETGTDTETTADTSASTADTGLCLPTAVTPVQDPPCDGLSSPTTEQAIYPVEEIAVAMVRGDEPGDQFGFELAVWQQQVIASTPAYQDLEEARAMVFSLPGLALEGALVEPIEYGEFTITSLEMADIDGDGVVEIAVGQPLRASPYDDSSGATHIVDGLPAGDVSLSLAASLSIYGPEYAAFGQNTLFAALGETPCEIELIIGAGGSSYLGIQGGIWAVDPNQTGELSWREAERAIRGEPLFGARFDALDLDGDGNNDIAAMSNIGVSYFAGPWVGDLQEEDRTAAWTETIEGDFGNTISSVGDVDGDGYEELAFAAPHYPEPEARAGRAYLVAGGQLPAGESPADDLPTRFEGRTFIEGMGWAIDSGDLDGDGQFDLVIGAANAYGAAIVPGQVLIYPGPVCEGVRTAEDAAIVITGESEGDTLGRALAITDADGDGRDDILAAAPLAPSGEGSGALYLVTSASLGL